MLNQTQRAHVNHPRPLLRWAGSKRRLVPVLQDYWRDSYNRYLEVFAGSAQLFFAIEPRSTLLNDVNSELIHTYKQVSIDPESIYRELSEYRVAKDEYYRIRSTNPHELSDIQRAARFIYLNRFCFNGIYRTNLKGEFNVPYSGCRTGGIQSLESFKLISAKLQLAQFYNLDFRVFLEEHPKAGDFVYLDPPYAVDNVRIFHQYDPKTFGLKDLYDLSIHLKKLNEQGVKFLLSYADSGEARKVFSDWQVSTVKTTRNVAGFAKHRREVNELLFSNVLP